MTWIKIVPCAAPNADGRWIEAPIDLPKDLTSWCKSVELLQLYVPDGHFVCSIEGDRRQDWERCAPNIGDRFAGLELNLKVPE